MYGESSMRLEALLTWRQCGKRLPSYYITRDQIFKQMVLSNLIEKIIKHEYPIIESTSCEDKAIGTQWRSYH